MTNAQRIASDYDALLVLSFGGPEGNEEVVPFLENVTRGRGIPRERLVVVGEHYFHFGGVSPLNELNREIIANIETQLENRGHNLPVYFGNRNWHPFGTEAVEAMAADGVRSALVLATSAWGGYSACRQYDEDILGLREHLAKRELSPISFTKLPQFFNHPKFISEMAQALSQAQQKVPEGRKTRVLFSAHSIPLAHDKVGGAPGDKNLYSRQVAEASRLVAEAVGISEYDLVWQSRSGNPATPWLEPDIVDHTKKIHEEEGIDAVVVCPIGFISDHMEVVWDLDTELRAATEELGIDLQRARTVGPLEAFSEMVVDLIEDLAAGRRSPGLGEVTAQGCTTNGAICAEGCCDIHSLRRPHTAATSSRAAGA